MCEVRVNDIVWDVNLTVKGDPKLQEDDKSVLGITRYDTAEVLIRMDISPELMYRTIKHELTHVYIFSYGIDSANLSEENVADFMESFSERIVEDAKYIYSELKKDKLLDLTISKCIKVSNQV